MRLTGTASLFSIKLTADLKSSFTSPGGQEPCQSSKDVVLSKHFFSKQWPQNELAGLMSREIVSTKVILPIWHHVRQRKSEEIRLSWLGA
jgi:hypothetical protein